MTTAHEAAVIVPAHNEISMLPRCLGALGAAVAIVAIPVPIVVVLDACDDDSISLRGRFGPAVHFLQVDGRNVGAARAAGFRYAKAALGSAGSKPGMRPPTLTPR